jgi:hypothetical protein
MNPMRINSAESWAAIAGYVVFGFVLGAIGIAVMEQSAFAGLAFLGFGGLCLFGAVHAFVSRRRYGRVVLDVKEPVVPGGRFQARLIAPGGSAGAQTLEAELVCKRVTPAPRSRNEILLWSKKLSFPFLSSSQGAHCDIAFDMPADALPSEGGATAARTRPGIYWELHVQGADVEGVDLMRAFGFPVVAGAPAPSA